MVIKSASLDEMKYDIVITDFSTGGMLEGPGYIFEYAGHKYDIGHNYCTCHEMHDGSGVQIGGTACRCAFDVAGN